MGKRTKSARKAARKSSSASVRRPLSSSFLLRPEGESNSPIGETHSPLRNAWVEFPTARCDAIVVLWSHDGPRSAKLIPPRASETLLTLLYAPVWVEKQFCGEPTVSITLSTRSTRAPPLCWTVRSRSRCGKSRRGRPWVRMSGCTNLKSRTAASLGNTRDLKLEARNAPIWVSKSNS